MSRAICPKCGKTDVSWIRDDADCAQYICLECKQGFCYPPKTVFDHITQSEGLLANELVYYLPEIDKYTSEIIAVFYKDRDEAFAATLAELKKEWKR